MGRLCVSGSKAIRLLVTFSTISKEGTRNQGVQVYIYLYSLYTMATRQESIQQLLAAEEEAQKIVAKAREDKSAKLKASKQQADSEVASYRAMRENEYQQKLAQRTGDVGANKNKLMNETIMKVDGITKGVNGLKPLFVDMLVKATTITNA